MSYYRYPDGSLRGVLPRYVEEERTVQMEVPVETVSADEETSGEASTAGGGLRDVAVRLMVPAAQIGEDWERWAALGYYRAEPIARAAWTTYETEWVLGEDLIYREAVITSTVDTAAQAAARVAEIDADLAALDAATVRPLRAVLAAQQAEADPAAEDLARLADLEARAQTLRAERAGLAEVA